MSDAVWLAIIVGVAAVVKQCFDIVALAVKEHFDRKRADVVSAKVAEVATKAEDVKKALVVSDGKTSDKLAELGTVAAATHTLVNNSMQIQLGYNAIMARRIAHMTKMPDDVAAADLADKLLAEHVSKQAVVDAAKIAH